MRFRHKQRINNERNGTLPHPHRTPPGVPRPHGIIRTHPSAAHSSTRTNSTRNAPCARSKQSKGAHGRPTLFVVRINTGQEPEPQIDLIQLSIPPAPAASRGKKRKILEKIPIGPEYSGARRDLRSRLRSPPAPRSPNYRERSRFAGATEGERAPPLAAAADQRRRRSEALASPGGRCEPGDGRRRGRGPEERLLVLRIQEEAPARRERARP